MMEHTRTPVADGDIRVHPPPEVPHVAPVNPLARLLPVAMVVAAAGMMVLYFTARGSAPRNPLFLLFPVMMVLSLLGTLAHGLRGNRTAELNQGRRDYLRYLDGLDGAAGRAAATQHRAAHSSHPAPETLWTLAEGPRRWERRPGDDEFGCVRVGIGTRPLSTRLVGPAARPVEEPDPVTTEAVDRLLRRRNTVADLPVTVDLFGLGDVSVDGDPESARSLVRACLCQVATWHSPEHVSITAVADDAACDRWDWLKWLPHHHRADEPGPAHRVVIVDEATPTPHEQDATVVIRIGRAADAAAQWFLDGDAVVLEDGTRARADRLGSAEARTCARRLTPYRAAVAVWSTRLEWAHLIGIANPDRLDLSDLWRARDPARELRVPVGVTTDGVPVTVDVKDAARHGMGPHGLCIGATGSGKSEFLRTFTLGMLATHSPERLNAILIDFKGGATFLGFDRAPHVSAVITNLADEAHLVARMKDALSGEVYRRQEILRSAGHLADITDYHRMRDRRPDLPALPALLVVVDEFSELLSQHPDFAELFVAIGRLGRSLGIHLLLASQRLDEGRLRGLDTHLSYRVCLKTFSASESRAVLGVPDAYHLPGTPGSAYLRTVAGELIRFQTAYVSARVCREPGGTAAPRVSPFSADRPAASATGTTTASAVVDRVLEQLTGRGPAAHPVWLPPLDRPPTLDQLLTSTDPTALTVPIGVVDRPFAQRRDRVCANLSGAAGHVAVVGGPGSGKSTALRTLALALAVTADPRAVQIYGLDFGGGALASLRPLPHVGAVAGRHETELVRRTVAELEALVRRREIRFRELGIDSMAEFRRRRSTGDFADADPFGDVFLFVDGWAAVRQDADGLEAAITRLAGQGLGVGVHVVIASSRWAEVRPALKDQLGTRIELRLGEPAESEMDRRRARELADCPPGRGIDSSGAEIAIALPRLDGVPSADGLTAALVTAGAHLTARYGGRRAPSVRLLPSRVELAALDAGPGHGTRITLGVGERGLNCVTVDFTDHAHLIVLGEPDCGKTSTLRALCTGILTANGPDDAQLVIVDVRRTLLGVVETDHLGAYLMSVDAVTAHLPSLLDELRSRLPGPHITQRQLRTRSWWTGPEMYVVVDDYDLVATAGGNPLTPLLEVLPHAEDIGLHLVIARRSGGAARAMFDPLLSHLRDTGSAALLMSIPLDEGVLLGGIRPEPRPPGRGALVLRGAQAEVVQVGWTEPP